jgi:diacylglycerol O-acyltransferase / wax synthase
VTQVAHAHQATVNDVLLAITAAGLRGLLISRGEPVADLTLPIYVPVSLRRDRSRPGTGNLISQMVVPLPLGTTDARQRLRRIAADTGARKANARPSLGTVFRSKISARVMLPLIAKQRVNVETADLPGPPAPRYFSGARVLEVFPLLNLIGNVSLGVGALSYAGQFNIMAVGDADTYPDIDVFTAGARNELSALIGAGKPTTRTG